MNGIHLAHKRLLGRAIGQLLASGRTGNIRFGGNLPITCFAYARRSPGRRRNPSNHPAVGIIREYLDEHYNEPVTLDTLAQVSRLSPFHALRVFREAEGTTPNGYQIGLRIRRACELLEQGSSIVDAALETGFYDQSHFTNTFRRIKGITPREYRKKRKILQEPES